MTQLQPITKRTSADIKLNLEQMAQIVGKKTFIDTLVLMEINDKPYYHPKDFYEAVIKMLEYGQNQRIKRYLDSFKI